MARFILQVDDQPANGDRLTWLLMIIIDNARNMMNIFLFYDYGVKIYHLSFYCSSRK